MPYIRPENRDTRYALWYETYQVRIPFIQMQDAEDLEENGLPTSGDKHHDHAMLWEPKLVSLPIHRMAELWSAGANISLVNHSDALKIYKAITAHLHEWRDTIENSINPVTPPTEDLLVLDGFASLMYPHAAVVYDQSFIERKFKITSATSIGRRAMLNAMFETDKRVAADKERGLLKLNNIEHYSAIPKYDPNATRAPIDYSGVVKKLDVSPRESLASLFKKEKR